MVKNVECYSLDWDTAYFGYESAKINIRDSVSEKEKLEISSFAKKYEFITISNINNNNNNNEWLGKNTSAFLTDVNIQFVKVIKSAKRKIKSGVTISNNVSSDEEILDIALNAFTISRFLNDSNLPLKKSEEMYYMWTKNAFNQLDKYFIICRTNDKVDGFLLFSLKDNKCIIELIAVHSKIQGKNIGSNLLDALETYLYDNEYYIIQVGTQINNVAAISFYTKVGFKYINLISTYHWWPNK